MSPSILLDETKPWLLAALASGILLLSVTLMMLCKCPRRKRANSKSETNVPTCLSAESPSEEPVVEKIVDDLPSNKTVEEEPMTTYCNNGCQGACACPAIDFQMTLTTSEPALREHSVLTPPPPPEDVLPTNPLPEIPKPESLSSIRQRRSSKNTLQHLVDKFVKRDIWDDESDNQRKGTKESKRKRSFFGRKTSVSENALHAKKEQSNGQVRKGGSNKQVSTSRNNKKVNQSGRNKEVRENGGIQEVSKGGSSQEVSEGGSNQETSLTDKNNSEIIIQQQRSKDSLKVLRGMMSFKKTASATGEEEWN